MARANGAMTRTIVKVLPIEMAIRNRNTVNVTGAEQMQEVTTGDILRTIRVEHLSLLNALSCRIVKALQNRCGRWTASKNLPEFLMI